MDMINFAMKGRMSLTVCLLLASACVLADGFPLVANPSFDDGRLGLPKTMGRDYWKTATQVRSER